MAKKKGNNYIIDKENNIAKIELRRRNKESLWAYVDVEDLQRVLNFPYTWFSKYDPDIDDFYAVATEYLGCENGKSINRPVHLHQFIMNANGKIVDHINHNTLDDRKDNLRIIPDVCNSTNRKQRNKNNKSGYRNVSWDKKCEKWNVQLVVDGVNTILAKFPKEQREQAGKFAELMRTKYYGEFAGKS